MSNEKISIKEAMELLTVGEVFAIERHFGKTLDGGQMSAMEVAAGAIYCLERRRSGPSYTWAHVEAMPLGDVNTYFRPEEMDADPDDPDSDEGKGGALAG